MSKTRNQVLVFFGVVVGLYFLVNALMQARGFLAPLAIAILVAVLLVPFSTWLEKKLKFGRGLAAFVSTFLAFVAFCGLAFVVSLQVNSMVERWPEIKENLRPRIEKLDLWLQESFDYDLPQILSDDPQAEDDSSAQTEQEAQAAAEQGQGSEISFGQQAKSFLAPAASVLTSFLGFLATALLTFIYIFFLLMLRSHFSTAFVHFFNSDRKKKVRETMKEAASVAQSYLTGMLMLVGFLFVIYALGLSLSGVPNALLVAMLAAILTFVPFVGNIIGFGLAIVLAAVSGGQLSMFVGIIATFVSGQLLENYVLQPLVVGQKVSLNPFFTIMFVVLGSAVWGIPGSIIAMPLFGVLKIIFDRIPGLEPLGELMGRVGEDGDQNFLEKQMSKIKDKLS